MTSFETEELDPKVEIVTDSDIFSSILQEELAKNDITFGGNPRDKEVNGYIQELAKNTSFAVSVEINGVTKIHYPDSGKRPNVIYPDTQVLVIRDLGIFVTKLEELSDAYLELKNQRHNYGPEPKSTDMESVWYNATPNDFANPEKFIDMYKQLLEGYKLQEIKQTQTEKFEIPSLRVEITSRLAEENNSYETPYAYVPIINFDREGHNVEYEPCKVRLGLFNDNGVDRAIIYAVQNSLNNKNEIETLLASLDQVRIYINEIATLFKQLYKINNDDFARVFGKFPPELFDEEDSTRFYRLFRELLLKNMIVIYGETKGGDLDLASFLLQRDFPEFKPEVGQNGAYLDNISKGIDRVRTLRNDVTTRPKRIRDEIADLESSDEIHKKIAKALKTSAPPNHVAGLTMTLAMLESLGIKEVKIPLYLPLRVRDHENRLKIETSDELEARKLNNLIEDVAYITENIKGVEVWQSPGESEDGASYLTLRLGEMSSDKTILQELLNAGHRTD